MGAAAGHSRRIQQKEDLFRRLKRPEIEQVQAALAQRLLAIAASAPGYSAVLNGRFKGGYITRQYGQPAQGIHAVQLEMTQCTYMQEQLPFDYLPDVAARVQPHLRALLEAALAFVEQPG